MLCPYCGAEVVLRNATYIYHDNKSKFYGKVWVCSNYPKCDAYVGCHHGTTIPKGRLANPRLRCLKMEAHKQFDPIWKSGLKKRRQAYKWLAEKLEIPVEECHIGMFDVKDCQRVIHLCRKFDDPLVSQYRKEHYSNRPVFTRGYNHN